MTSLVQWLSSLGHFHDIFRGNIDAGKMTREGVFLLSSIDGRRRGGGGGLFLLLKFPETDLTRRSARSLEEGRLSIIEVVVCFDL